jgi:hypothetical protein
MSERPDELTNVAAVRRYVDTSAYLSHGPQEFVGGRVADVAALKSISKQRGSVPHPHLLRVRQERRVVIISQQHGIAEMAAA